MPAIEYIALCNHAEAREGLLYLSGAGWSHHWRGGASPEGQAPPSHLGIAVSILVPWGDTNRRHRLILRMESEDGPQLVEAQADLEMGRPPGTPIGSDQRAVLAFNIDTVFPAAGGYRVVAEMGDEMKSVSFWVHDQPAPQAG